jgi:hypothetical protein
MANGQNGIHVWIGDTSEFNDLLKAPMIVYYQGQTFAVPFLWINFCTGRDVAKKDVTRDIAVDKPVDSLGVVRKMGNKHAYPLTASSGMPLPPFLALILRSCSNLHSYTM